MKPSAALAWAVRSATALAFLAAALAVPSEARAASREAPAPPAAQPVPPAEAPAVPPLTLPEAVSLARRNSPAILESAAQAEAARQARSEARSSRLPSVEIREMAMRTDSPADVFGLRLSEERFSFPSFVSSDPNAPEPLDHYATQVQASLPLFTGGRLSGGIRRADRMAEAASAIQAHTESATSMGVADAYMNALLADAFVALAEQARATTERHLEQAQSFYDAGMIVESDLLQARVQMARMDENLIRAKNGAALARAGLDRAIGIPLDSAFALDDSLPPAPPAPASLGEALASASAGRKDVRAASAAADAATAAASAAAGERWPEIALLGTYSLSDDTPFHSHGRNYTVMAVARWNLWNWGATAARVGRGKSEERAAFERERDRRAQAELDVRQAWQSLEESLARHEVATRGVASAERATAILEDRFTQGVARITDLLDAETAEHEARVGEVQARFDMQRSVRHLRFAAGLDPVPEAAR